jgi:hypothetical protein
LLGAIAPDAAISTGGCILAGTSARSAVLPVIEPIHDVNPGVK